MDRLNKVPQTWSLSIPDWKDIDTIWKKDFPFVLWVIGEQELLFHWLDYAVNKNYEKVVLYVSDRPMLIRQAVANASLWPIEIEVRPVSSTKNISVHDVINRLPNTKPDIDLPKNGWDLICYWKDLEEHWLHRFTEETKDYGSYVSIGKYCEIAKDSNFIKPYWIGDFVSIGPGCSIGPNVVIESGCIVSGNNVLTKAHLGPNTYLGPETDLIDASIDKNELTSIKNKAYVRGLEALIASGLNQKKQTEKKPSLRERFTALKLYLKWKKHGFTSETTFEDIKGNKWPLLQSTKIHARGPWLALVVKGKLPLFGVTPRPPSALRSIPDEWQNVISDAPLGAFSYADVMGVHEIGSEEEALHCAYQTTTNAEQCYQQFNNWLEQLKYNEK